MLTEDKTVMIVDDDPAILCLYRDFLEMKGFDVLVFLKGEEAREHLQKEKVDFLLTDFHLGSDGIDGVDLVLESKKRSIPSVIITGNAEKAQERANESGVEETLLFQKPVIFKELLNKIKTLI